MEQEQRAAPRTGFYRPVQIRMVGGQLVAAKTTNISAGGVCLLAADPLKMNSTCLISFDIDLEGAFQKVNIVSQVCNVSFSGQGTRIGLKFLQFEGNSASIINKYIASITPQTSEAADENLFK